MNHPHLANIIEADDLVTLDHHSYIRIGQEEFVVGCLTGTKEGVAGRAEAIKPNRPATE